MGQSKRSDSRTYVLVLDLHSAEGFKGAASRKHSLSLWSLMSQRAHCPSQVGGHNTGQLLALTHSFVPFQSLGSSNKEGSQCWWMAVNRGLHVQSYCCCLFFLHSSSQCMDMLWWNCKNICVDISYIWMNESEQRLISSWNESDSALNCWPYSECIPPVWQANNNTSSASTCEALINIDISQFLPKCH